MQQIPDGYEPYRDNRYIDFGMSFGVVAVDAAALAIPSSSESYDASQIEQTHDDIEQTSGKYTTLEHNMFILDGSMTLYSEDLSGMQTGWISSDLSKMDGGYDPGVHLAFHFSKPQDSYGLTLVFDQQLPENIPAEIQVTFYDMQGVELFSKREAPTAVYYWLDAPVQQYSGVRIDFLSSKIPYRRVRVTEVIFGIVTAYDRKTIASASDRQSVDLLSESLPSAEVTIKIDNSDKLYNLINPHGVYEYLQDGQHINYWIAINDVKINMGVRYFRVAESDDGGLTATITFNDRLIFLDDAVYSGGASGTWTLSEAVASILTAAEVDSELVFDDDLENVVIRKCVPQNTTCREAIRLCAQAAMCICKVNRKDQLHFMRPEFSEAAHDLVRDSLREEPSVVVEDRYNAVKVTRRDEYTSTPEDESYTASAAKADEMTLTKEINNPLVVDLQEFAEWALSWVQRRTAFRVEYRGNPALDLCDTIKVYDVFGVNGNALIESSNLDYDGGLTGNLKARR